MKVLMGVVGIALLTGCGATSTLKLENGLLIEEAGQTNLFRPSLSVLQVSKCLEQDGVTTTIDIDGSSHTCYGKYERIAIVQGTQAGSMTGLGGSMVEGGAMFATGAVASGNIKDGMKGMRPDQTTVNQSGGGANASAFGQGNSSAAASGGAGGNGYGYGGKGGSSSSMSSSGMPMRGRD